MGLYTVFAPAYEQFAVTVAMRCGEGAQAMLEVGDRLRRVAKIYDDGEAYRQSVMDKLHPAKRGGDPR
jgi:hypothetical protein